MFKKLLIPGAVALAIFGVVSCGGGKNASDTLANVTDENEMMAPGAESNFVYDDSDSVTIAKMNLLTVIDTTAQRPSELYANADGLKYRVIKDGDGVKPEPGKTAVFNIETRLPDGTIIANTFGGAPMTQQLNDQLMPALNIGLQEMSVGAIYEFFIPEALSGDQKADIISVIQLIEVK